MFFVEVVSFTEENDPDPEIVRGVEGTETEKETEEGTETEKETETETGIEKDLEG